MEITNSLSSLVAARRLMIMSQELEARRKGKKVVEKTPEETMKEDQAILSGGVPGDQPASPQPKLIESALRLDELNQRAQGIPVGAPAQDGVVQTAVEVVQQETVEFSLKYSSLAPVEGLVLRSKQVAETDRYAFEFSDGATFKIIDKWSGRSTRIWGDPHVDTDDQEGDRNGEFSDMKGSDSQTTLMLMDGTRVTFTAKDDGLIERVDLFKGSQHLGGVGAGSSEFKDQTGLFADSIDQASPAGVPAGDTVYAGGDGNDWFSSTGTLLWGKTTGPVITSRPSAFLELSYRHSLIQSVTASKIKLQA